MSNVCRLHNHYHHPVRFLVQHFFSKYVTTVQTNCIIFFQECFEISIFFKYINVHFYKHHWSTWRKFKGWKNLNSGAQILCAPCWNFWWCRDTCAPRRKVHFVVLFSEILNEIVYLKCALAICKTCQFITLPRSGDFQFAPFQWIWFRTPQMDAWCMMQTCTKFSQPWMWQ